ncbi:spindle pole body interacting protein [Hymenopellis radicata]|nr:spindle pole body interacting protein [Hymenopellis radicata]
MSSQGNHCSFVLLAEFHILEGAQLKYQFPQPLGVDEQVLAMSMLPDGAEMQVDDWTIFFLNQTPFNTISPVVGLDSPDLKASGLPGDEGAADEPDLLCVLNLVRTKHDKTLNRGAQVLALAICTRHPFIQIFKPVLLMALDDYLLDPSQDCLARLFDAVNSMDLSGAPTLTRFEKMVMRCSERKDVFAEKFEQQPQGTPNALSVAAKQHRSSHSGESFASFEDGLLLRGKEKEKRVDENRLRERDWDNTVRPRADTVDSHGTTHTGNSHQTTPPSDTSFTLGGSAVWVGDESGLEDVISHDGQHYAESVVSIAPASTLVGSGRKRRSTDGSSQSSHMGNPTLLRPPINPNMTSFDSSHSRGGWTKDTHFFHTTLAYRDHQLPIKNAPVYLSRGSGRLFVNNINQSLQRYRDRTVTSTPALERATNTSDNITGKRIMFLGHKRPAGEVSSFVLAACALGSGCGAVLRGFIERAFPYANLNNRDEWEAVPAYIAGVTNPIFESSRAWDLLLDISTGHVVVAKDIHATYPTTPGQAFNPPLITRSGTLKAEASLGVDDEMMKAGGKGPADFVPKADNNADSLFMEDIKAAIEYHYGESLVRVRFVEYVTRFVRMASRYEEEASGVTSIGYPSNPFLESSAGRTARLGSGVIFNDDSLGLKELVANAPRVDAWRKTNTYQYYMQDFKKSLTANPIKGFDVVHQIFRLRHAKKMGDAEVSLLMQTLADNVNTYDQVVELLSYLMPHSGGLLPLGFGLFHQDESVRNRTVDLFNQIRAYPIGVLFLQALNHFQRYAYVRQAHARVRRPSDHPPALYPPAVTSRTHSNSSATMPADRLNGAF